MSDLPKHVIHQPNPARRLALIVTAIVLICTLVWLYIDQTNADMKRELQDLRQQNHSLIADNHLITSEYHRLNEQLLATEQHLAIQNETDQQLKQQLSHLQNELIDLNRELAFYHNITQGNASSELQVRELQLFQDSETNQLFHYRLVLSQGKKITRPITGSISMTLKANKAAQKVELPIAKHAFKLRHVQVLTGQITLDGDINPDSITVTVKQKKQKSRSQHFDWKITAGPA